jgi:predicted GNAT family acetyltransferase
MENTNNMIIEEADAPDRFEFTEQGKSIGFIEYYAFEHIAIIVHTEVNSALEGKGHGSRVAQHALEYMRGQQKQVVPICGFFAHFLRKHPEYTELVTPESRRIFKI